MDICVDFDGTVVTHEFPQVGENIGAADVLLKLVDEGHNIILFTMRSNGERGPFLDDAIEWFTRRSIPLHGIQKNPDQEEWTSSPKAYGQLYIDDSALGAPLIYPDSGRPYIDWDAVEDYLISQGILPTDA